MLGLWAILLVALASFALVSGHAQGFGGRPLLSALLAFALLLAALLLFAAQGVTERFIALTGPGAGWLLGLFALFVFLLYALGTGSFSPLRLGAAAAFLFVPLLLLAPAKDSAPGRWQDLLTIALIWTAVKFGPSHWLWPYPGERLAYIFTILLAMNAAIAGFLLLRGTKNTGYSIGWGSGFSFSIFVSLLLFAAIAIPLGTKIRFIDFAPRYHEWKTLLPVSAGILFFTAWPEEFLFRGLLQNHLSRAANSDAAGWICASILFGFSHITNMHFPNWRYVLLASIAGFFYGWTWRRTNSLFASAIVHAAVDTLWHFLFRTL